MDDLGAVMEAAGCGRAAIIGISEGGPMSILFAATYPDRVSSLVLYGTYARMVNSPDYKPRHPGRGPRSLGEDDARGMGRAARRVAVGAELRRRSRVRTLVGTRPPPGDQPLGRDRADRPLPRAGRAGGPAEHRRADPRPAPQGRQDRAGAAGPLPGRADPGGPLRRAARAPTTCRWPSDQDALLDEVEEFLTGSRRAREPERALATVLFTDIVGSTERAAELGDRAWRDLLERHDAIVRRQLAIHRGREVKTLGDGFLAVFDGPARAIRCAAAIRDELAAIGVRGAVRHPHRRGRADRRGRRRHGGQHRRPHRRPRRLGRGAGLEHGARAGGRLRASSSPTATSTR